MFAPYVLSLKSRSSLGSGRSLDIFWKQNELGDSTDQVLELLSVQNGRCTTEVIESIYVMLSYSGVSKDRIHTRCRTNHRFPYEDHGTLYIVPLRSAFPSLPVSPWLFHIRLYHICIMLFCFLSLWKLSRIRMR